MEYNFILLVISILLAGCSNGKSSIHYDNDFTKRNYELTIPQNYDEKTDYSLLFVFHGSGGTGEGMRQLTLFDDYAEEKSLIICYPDAVVENWEEGCECNKPYRLGIDDVGFVSYLIDKLTAQYNIDTTKIFGVGYSQGGLFTMNLACKLSNKFAAIATVASSMSTQLFNNCEPSNNVSVLMIHGTQDRLAPFNGVEKGFFSLVSSRSTIKLWAESNDCSPQIKNTKLFEAGLKSVGVVKHEYSDCSLESKVVLFEIVNGGHLWFSTKELDATEEIVKFFFQK